MKSRIDYSKNNFSEDEKNIIRNEIDLVKTKYPDLLPVVVHSNDIPLVKFKYLVPKNITIGQFLAILHKKANLDAKSGLFLFINDQIPMTSQQISLIYDQLADKETSLLYVKLTKENTFGFK